MVKPWHTKEIIRVDWGEVKLNYSEKNETLMAGLYRENVQRGVQFVVKPWHTKEIIRVHWGGVKLNYSEKNETLMAGSYRENVQRGPMKTL